MSDIELVIKISEDSYKATCNGWMSPSDVDNVVRGIKNGTSFPKGYGRLIDAEEMRSIFKKLCDDYNIDNLSFIADMDMNFDLASIIIEADTAESDE